MFSGVKPMCLWSSLVAQVVSEQTPAHCERPQCLSLCWQWSPLNNVAPLKWPSWKQRKAKYTTVSLSHLRQSALHASTTHILTNGLNDLLEYWNDELHKYSTFCDVNKTCKWRYLYIFISKRQNAEAGSGIILGFCPSILYRFCDSSQRLCYFLL